MIDALNEVLDRLWLAQFALVPLVLGPWMVLRFAPLRPSTRAMGAFTLLVTLMAPAFMPTVSQPGPTLAAIRGQFARTEIAYAFSSSAGNPWPFSTFETIWLIGSLALLLRGMANLMAARSYLRRLPAPPSDIAAAIERIAAEVGVRRLRVRTTDDTRSPAIYCVPNPTLVFPTALWRRLPAATRGPIVRHELAHMRRGDPWLCGVGTLITMVIWWNPLAWLLRAGMHRYREMAADAWAIRRGTEPPEELARGLLATQCWVTQRGSDGRHGVSIAAVPSRGFREMTHRIRQLFRRRMFGGALLGGLLCAVLAVMVGQIGWVVAQTPGGIEHSAERLSLGGFLARALITLEGESRVEELPRYLERLEHGQDAKLRRAAADDLGNLFENGMPAVPALLKALEHDTSESVRREAADALARIGATGAPAVRARLRERLRIESSARVRRQLEDVLTR